MGGSSHTLRWPRVDASSDAFPDIDGASPQIDALKQHMRRVADDAYVTVLILGESGTGKERVARAIHDRSPRRNAPFVVVNCAGLSPSLIEDELFGHVRGAFTGAMADQPGPFERANGGTVFLDEVGELTPELQLKLLRAIQQRTVQRLGGTRETPFDVRVIAATNADLSRAVAQGRFRQDLYFRLKVYELRVPPLRHRGAPHVRLLAATILKQLGARRKRPPAALDAHVWDRFVDYAWPGNVRELENTLERMVVAAGASGWLTVDHLPEGFGVRAERETGAPAVLPDRDAVIAALERHGFARGRAAAALGVSRHQLYRLIRRYQISSE